MSCHPELQAWSGENAHHSLSETANSPVPQAQVIAGLFPTQKFISAGLGACPGRPNHPHISQNDKLGCLVLSREGCDGRPKPPSFSQKDTCSRHPGHPSVPSTPRAPERPSIRETPSEPQKAHRYSNIVHFIHSAAIFKCLKILNRLFSPLPPLGDENGCNLPSSLQGSPPKQRRPSVGSPRKLIFNENTPVFTSPPRPSSADFKVPVSSSACASPRCLKEPTKAESDAPEKPPTPTAKSTFCLSSCSFLFT